MRKTIANQLGKSKREIPHFYLRKNVYVDTLLSARKLLNKKLESKTIKDKVETLENIISFYLHEVNFSNQTIQ